MFRRRFLIGAAVVVFTLVIAFGRLYKGIPFVPASGREIVARLSGLPIPIFVKSSDAVDKCAGFLCQDYYGRGLIQLDSAPCAKAVESAKTQSWRPLPLPDDIASGLAQAVDAPPTPRIGYFRFTRPDPEEHTFAWIDTSTCRVYAEVNIW